MAQCRNQGSSAKLDNFPNKSVNRAVKKLRFLPSGYVQS